MWCQCWIWTSLQRYSYSDTRHSIHLAPYPGPFFTEGSHRPSHIQTSGTDPSLDITSNTSNSDFFLMHTQKDINIMDNQRNQICGVWILYCIKCQVFVKRTREMCTCIQLGATACFVSYKCSVLAAIASAIFHLCYNRLQLKRPC